MTLDNLRNYCLSLKCTEEKMPFDDKVIVFTVKGKIFCLTDIFKFKFINLKCKPEDAIILREKYEDVIPGYHMNKNHWNSVKINNKISDAQIKAWIFDSYNLIIAGLPKKIQKDLI